MIGADYLERVRRAHRYRCAPVSGSARASRSSALRGHVDGVVVGSALVEVLERGESAPQFLSALRG